jgi:hypothetical protein
MSVNIPNDPEIYQHFPINRPPKFTQIGILGFNRNHLATLVSGHSDHRQLLCANILPDTQHSWDFYWSCFCKFLALKAFSKMINLQPLLCGSSKTQCIDVAPGSSMFCFLTKAAYATPCTNYVTQNSIKLLIYLII